MTLDAAALGSRIVVRHETGGVGPSGGPEMNDVIGHVRALDDETVTLELRDGRTAVVARRTIVTWKPVPARPLRRRKAADTDPGELTRVTSRGWPAPESVQLGDWELRAAGRFTGRANSVAVTGSPGVPYDEAVAQVREFYAVRSMPALAQVVTGSPDDEAFGARGWVPLEGYYGGAVVQVADLDPAYEADPSARVSPTADDEWLSHYGRVDDAVAARAVMEGPATVGFVSVGDPVVAIGRVVVTGEWAGLSAVEVVPSHRRQGLAGRIVLDVPVVGRRARGRQGVPADHAVQRRRARAVRAVRVRRPPRLPLPGARARRGPQTLHSDRTGRTHVRSLP